MAGWGPGQVGRGGGLKLIQAYPDMQDCVHPRMHDIKHAICPQMPVNQWSLYALAPNALPIPSGRRTTPCYNSCQPCIAHLLVDQLDSEVLPWEEGFRVVPP